MQMRRYATRPMAIVMRSQSMELFRRDEVDSATKTAAVGGGWLGDFLRGFAEDNGSIGIRGGAVISLPSS